MEALLLLVYLLVPLILGVPIAFSLGIAGILGTITFLSPVQLVQQANIVFTQTTSSTLLVVPLFVLMAEILIVSNISKDVFDAASKWLSRLPGGLAVTVVAACTGFAAVTGSSAATVATVGSMSVPEMIRRGYNARLSAGTVVTGGTLGILIPPSLALITYGILTETSIVKLFIAGVLPGIIIALMLALVIICYAVLKPESAPRGQSYSFGDRLISLLKVIPIVVIAIFILGSMYTGIATPTESASIGAVVSLAMAAAYRRLTLQNFKLILMNTAKTTSMVLLLLCGGMSFNFIVGYLKIPEQLVSYVTGFDLNPWIIFSLFILILLVLGCFLEPFGMMVLTMPFMFPAIVHLGFDPVWFGIIFTITAEIGMITPPVGINLFVLKTSVPQLEFSDIIKGALPFILVLLGAIVLFSIFPNLVTGLL